MEITEYPDSEYKQLINIRGGLNKQTRSCFVLFFDKQDKSIIIEEVSRDRLQKCFTCSDPFDSQGIALKVLRAILQIVERKKAHTVELTDTSTRVCSTATNKSFQLSNMYFLTYGKTWYETNIPGLECSSADISMDRELVHTNKWSDIVQALVRRNEYDRFAESLTEPIPAEIDPMGTGSAMQVFRWMRSTEQCRPFCEFMGTFILGSGIQNMFGTSWKLTIPR